MYLLKLLFVHLIISFITLFAWQAYELGTTGGVHSSTRDTIIGMMLSSTLTLIVMHLLSPKKAEQEKV